MPNRRRAGVAAAIVATIGTACASNRIDLSVPPPPGRALVVLLPDANGSVGRANVSNGSGSVELDAAREATQAAANRRPTPVTTFSGQDVNRIFGDVLSALPPAPQQYVLFFRFESDELTDESRALVLEIQKAVAERQMPDIAVVGHTDTMGTPRANFELGLKRATMVRGLLASAGLDASTIDVTSLGEADLLTKTPDETPEPRNRRVEVTLR